MIRDFLAKRARESNRPDGVETKVMPRSADSERARALILRHGWNATAYQLLNPGIELWFSRRGDAVIGYVRRKGCRVVAGAPVCTRERLRAVVAEWEADATASGERVSYFGAAGRVIDLLGSSARHSTVVLGAQPTWRPDRWERIVQADASLRAQFNRARNKGVTVTEWDAGRATDNPDLRRVLGEWLETRGLPPLHFLVEPETLRKLEDRRVFVAERKGRVVGFTVLSPVPVRAGWLTEQFVRGREAPNGTVELLLDTAIRTVAAEGAQYVTMGLVPLSVHGQTRRFRNPTWLRGLLAWVRAHGRRFYNFAGLEAFKSKFHPDYWEPIYAISNETTFSFGTLYSIAAAFSDGSPVVAVLRGLGRAIRQEARWLARRIA